MVCGEEKVLAEAMPAEDIAVPGFEHQTLECPGCNDTERRLVFTGRVIVIARRDAEAAASFAEPRQRRQNGWADSSTPDAETTYNGSGVEHSITTREEKPNPAEVECAGEVTEVSPSVPEPPLRAPEPSAGAGINISAPGWLRATDKLRTYQADLHLRDEKAKERNRNIKFDMARDSFAVPRDRAQLLAAQPRNSVQSHRERLRRTRLSTESARPSQLPAPIQERDAESVRRFNELWDSLAPSRSPQHLESSASASVPALPISLGKKLLDAVEAVGLSR
jgi:hypothetical protein